LQSIYSIFGAKDVGGYKMNKRILAIFLATAMIIGSGCTSPAKDGATGNTDETVTESTDTSETKADTSDAAETEASSEEVDAAGTDESAESGTDANEATASADMVVGETYHGFKLNDIYSSRFLSSDLYTFKHEKSGADLIYTKNSDPEVSFCIAYRTPYIDETDTNHVFEHAILASSAKYPSKDLFFDLANKSYNTYINAHTTFNNTNYPVASMSQDQLITLMDAYMSCMVEPDILTNENFFNREAIRFELDDPEGDIGINGTVYAEDYGFLTDVSNWSIDCVLNNMFPGQIASNMLGMAEYHYDDLTYEHTIETYERCYHFDNSLISLYGDLDIDRFLEFLDTEYLSKYEVYGTDLSQYEDPHAEDGYVEKVEYIPAYEGDSVEDSGKIYYAIDMEDATDDELIQWDFLTTLINNNSSCMNKKLLEDGISNPVSAYIATDIAKPVLIFTMEYANEDQMQSLKDIAEYTFSEIAENGFPKEIFEAEVKGSELSTVFIRDSANVGVNLSNIFNIYWARTGRVDYYEEYERVLDELIADEEQQTFKKLAADALTPARSVLVACLPKPGLAEEFDQKLLDYLADKKAKMSDEEIQELVKKTQEFNEWNQGELSNNDFLMDLKDLPEYSTSTFEKREEDGITYYLGSVDATKGGYYDIYFDLSNLTKEEISTLMLYTGFLFETNTTKYDTDELTLLSSEYLNSFGISPFYPNIEAEENHRPMLHIVWKGLNEDFEKALDLVMNVMTETDLNDSQNIKYVISRDREAYNLAKADAYSMAYSYSQAAGTTTLADTERFGLDIYDPNFYDYISELDKNIDSDEAYNDLIADIESVRKKAFTKTNLIFSSVADKNENEEVIKTAAKIFGSLPECEESADKYELPVFALKTGIIVESSQNNTVLDADFRNDESFRGAYIPFIYAASDKYVVPTIRFQMGAYSAASSAVTRCYDIGAYTYSDPNVKESVEALEKIPEAIKTITLDEEELTGYILNAYGDDTKATGIWFDTVKRIRRDILGVDEDVYLEMVNDMKNSDLSLQPQAAESYEKIFKNASLATVGNEGKITADKDAFDEVLNYKK
jgi:Zn-dependent M16 (insulinase) family peptidase